MERRRCSWCNPNNPLYLRYHDEEWGVLRTDDPYLYEMLILESFQAGLSWECVLNKREAFRRAYDGFCLEKVCGYGEEKVAELLENKDIIRNRLTKHICYLSTVNHKGIRHLLQLPEYLYRKRNLIRNGKGHKPPLRRRFERPAKKRNEIRRLHHDLFLSPSRRLH